MDFCIQNDEFRKAAARLLGDHGTRSMADVAAPAIDIARGGITMTHHLYNALHGSVPEFVLKLMNFVLKMMNFGRSPAWRSG